MSTTTTNDNASAATTAQTIELSHGQLVRVRGFKNWNDITVGTIAGYEKENVLKYSKDKSEEAIKAAQEEGLARAKKFGHSLAPWTTQAAGVLMDNFSGKEEMLNKERAARAAAVEIENGQTVVIEGAKYTVRVVGEGYSDPVHFKAA